MFQFSSIGMLAVVAVTLCWILAWVLYRVSAAGGVGRKLSLLLFVEGITLISTGYIDLFLTATARAHDWYPAWYRAEEFAHTAGDCAMLALYPPFLAAALKTRLTRVFAGRRVQVGLVTAASLLFAFVLMSPHKYGATLLYLMLSLLFAYALVASVHAWHTATGRAARTRAGIFAMAFGFRDICWGFIYGSAVWMIWFGTYLVVDPDASGAPYIVYALGTLIAVPLIAYGVLRTQLFDIDLRIHWTIRQSTVASVFVAIFYLVSEGADRLLSSELGNWVGLFAAALVMFFLAPLQRLADRVASAAMPNTENTPEYAAFRKMQVYEEAVSEAHFEGGISAKERVLLVRLRDSLGISAADAEVIERELKARITPVS